MSRNQNFAFHGLREDDAALSLGAAYAPDAEGSAEADRGALRGLREDDAALRMGVSAYDRLQGLREDDAAIAMQGLREDDAALRMGVSAYDKLQGLREDDAALRMGYTPVYGFSSEVGPEPRLAQPGLLVSNGRVGGLREDDAAIQIGVSAYDKLGAAYAPDAEGSAEADRGALRGLREDDAALRMGVSAYDALKGLREDDAGTRLGVSAYDVLKGLREDDAALRMGAAYAPDAEGSAEADRGALRGLREDDASLQLGDDLYRQHRYAKAVRFDYGKDHKYDIAGRRMGGWLDFLKPAPSSSEYLGALQLLVTQWEGELRPNLIALPMQSHDAILKNMAAAECDYNRCDGLRAMLNEGYAGYQQYPGRWDRVKRMQAYFPTLRTLIAEAKSVGTARNAAEEQARVDATAVKAVDTQVAAAEKSSILTDYVLPIGGAAAITGGLIFGVVKLIGR